MGWAEHFEALTKTKGPWLSGMVPQQSGLAIDQVSSELWRNNKRHPQPENWLWYDPGLRIVERFVHWSWSSVQRTSSLPGGQPSSMVRTIPIQRENMNLNFYTLLGKFNKRDLQRDYLQVMGWGWRPPNLPKLPSSTSTSTTLFEGRVSGQIFICSNTSSFLKS